MKSKMSFYSFQRSRRLARLLRVWCECRSHSSIDLFGDLLRHSITHTSLASLFMRRWQKTIRIWLHMDYFDAQAVQRDGFSDFVNLEECSRHQCWIIAFHHLFILFFFVSSLHTNASIHVAQCPTKIAFLRLWDEFLCKRWRAMILDKYIP